MVKRFNHYLEPAFCAGSKPGITVGSTTGSGGTITPSL